MCVFCVYVCVFFFFCIVCVCLLLSFVHVVVPLLLGQRIMLEVLNSLLGPGLLVGRVAWDEGGTSPGTLVGLFSFSGDGFIRPTVHGAYAALPLVGVVAVFIGVVSCVRGFCWQAKSSQACEFPSQWDPFLLFVCTPPFKLLSCLSTCTSVWLQTCAEAAV